MKATLPRFAFEAEDVEPYKPEEPPAINEAPTPQHVTLNRTVLTPRQLEVFSFIVDHYAKNGEMPTYRAISESIGSASANGVTYHLKKLLRVGLLVRREQQGRHRAIVIAGLAERVEDHVRTHALNLLQWKQVLGGGEPVPA